jgi:hypothetical protein
MGKFNFSPILEHTPKALSSKNILNLSIHLLKEVINGESLF